MEESLAKRINKRLAESENFDNESSRSESPFSLSGGSIPAPPPESGMSAPKGMVGRLGFKKKLEDGSIDFGGTGISIDTPQGKINKLAAADINYEKDGFKAGVKKPVGGRGAPRFQVGYSGSFKKGGAVRSKASKRADGIATKGFTRAKYI